ncbi:MAG: hypothetical protein ACI4KF_03360 [Huintestinicola sp.]
MMIGFHIPDFWCNGGLNYTFILVKKENPEFFRDGVEIASVFGSFPLIWNGGRMTLGEASDKQIISTIEDFNEIGVPLRFTFTNPMITEKHLDDPRCNFVLKAADNGMNEVIVNSPILEEYIRANYPGYKLTSSTCKCIKDEGELQKEFAKDYSLVVLDYGLNHDMELLSRLTPEQRRRSELLINAVCRDNCPRRKEHYAYVGRMQLEGQEIGRLYNFDKETMEMMGIVEWECDHMSRDLYRDKPGASNISPSDVYRVYAPMGFGNFKIEGRGANIVDLCEQYLNYMVKDEFRDRARYMIMKKTMEFKGF